MTEQRVIVVGGGLSGLSAAKLLYEKGVDVLVLEASDRIGGRLHTVKNSSVGYTDLGGAYVGPSQNRILRLAEELNVKTFKIYSEKSLIRFTKGKTYVNEGSHFLPLSAGLLPFLDMNHLVRSIDRLGEKIPASCPWEAPNADVLDKMTFREWLQKIMWTEHGMAAAEQISQVNFTAEPHAISLLWALWYIKCAGGMARISYTEGGAQERKFVGGAQQIPEQMAESLGVGDRVLTEKCVVKIQQSGQGVKVSTSDGHVYQGTYVIMAVPPALHLRIVFEPPLSGNRNQLISKYPMGSVIKTMMFYDKPYWREKGYNGCMEVADNDPDVPIGYTADDCKPDGSKPCIIGFILGNKATKMSGLTKEERRKKIAKQYSVVFDCPEMEKPVHYVEKDWTSDPWTGGCYTGYLGPGVITLYKDTIQAPVGRVYMAGTEAATTWSGFMEGAVQAGERAAREILCDMNIISKEEVWMDEAEVIPVPPLDPGLLERHAPSVKGLIQGLTAISAAAAAVGLALVMAKL